jgi:hypothetical protein
MEKLEKRYFFISVNNKCVCLICNASVAVSNKCNVEWHFMTMHKDYKSKYLDNSKLQRNKVGNLRYQLQSRQAIFCKAVNKAKATTVAWCKITENLAMKTKPFEDGNVVKECLAVAGDSLFNEFNIETEISNAIKGSVYLRVLSLEE